MVWHAGHDRAQSWARDGEWVDTDDDDGDQADGRLPPDPESDAYRQQPDDEEDRMMNQALADFFLNDFEDAMQRKLGLTADNAMQNAEYRMMIASRDAMRHELERRRDDGTVRLQPNPFLGRSAAGLSSSGLAGQGGGGDDDEDDEDDEDDDDDDDDGASVTSTDSKFGVDPRFATAVDEELRAQRLGEWVERLLISTARRTGGACRDVKITDVKVSAQGLKVWWYRDRNKRKPEKWLDRVFSTETLAAAATRFGALHG